MATTVHWDPSALKAMYSPTDGRVMVSVGQCTYCRDEFGNMIEMPTYMTVEFAGIKKCSDQSDWDYFNDTIWQLTYAGDCVYTAAWSDSGYSGIIQLLYSSGATTLVVWDGDIPGSDFVFRCDVYDDCVQSAEDVANYHSSYPCDPGVRGYGGTASWCEDWNPSGCP